MLDSLGSGLVENFKRRSQYYISDFTDGIIDKKSLQKTISTTTFLYFSVILPCIAFGVVDTNNTNGHIDPKKTLIGQAIGGLIFAFIAGQPLIVVMTTAPLCIYVRVIYMIAQDFNLDFGSFYACVGLWMSLFLVIMSVTNTSNLMKYCTRSTEDIFALFTAFAFGSDGVMEAVRSFKRYYWVPSCSMNPHAAVSLASKSYQRNTYSPRLSNSTGNSSLYRSSLFVRNPSSSPSSSSLPSMTGRSVNSLPIQIMGQNSSIPILSATNHQQVASSASISNLNQYLNNNSRILYNNISKIQHSPSMNYHDDISGANVMQQQQPYNPNPHYYLRCQRETCILFLLLMCGTLWLANSFVSFHKTPYLSSKKREIIKDYALAMSVLIFSFIGSYLFMDIKLDLFEFSDFGSFHFAQLDQLTYRAILLSCPFGFMLSVLFFIDQNICGAMVNNSPYKLKKGDYFHLDLLILAILNTGLSLTGLPWMHGKLPHSHLHSKALADYEESIEDGHVHQTIVNIRETRLTGIFCSLLIAGSLYAVPYPLSYIPLPVLSGVFLYTALAELKSNSMVERICLLFTERSAYPANHYIRRCSQNDIHLFTTIQVAKLGFVSFVGFYPNPYVNMAFPLAVALFVPIRSYIMPKIIDSKNLSILDPPSLE